MRGHEAKDADGFGTTLRLDATQGLILGLSLLTGDALLARGEIISADRRIDWRGLAGVPDGIPHRTTIFASVKDAPYGTMGDA